MNQSLIATNTNLALAGHRFANMRIAFVYDKVHETLVDQLIGLFRSVGIKCWTHKNILGGDREYAIKRALKEADFILVVGSDQSFNTAGFFQKLIDWSLDAGSYLPKSGIKVIPLLLNPCEIDGELGELQPVKAYEIDPLSRLVASWAKEWQRRTAANDWPQIKTYLSNWQ